MLGALTLPLYVYVWVGPDYQLWAKNVHKALYASFIILDTIFSQASFVSAVFISIERFHAIFWPLRHQTLSMRAYCIVIFMVWSQAIFLSMVFNLSYLISSKHVIYASEASFALTVLTYLIIICGCNFGIWRKFQHESIVSRRHQNRASQNRRFTKTLLFIFVLAVLSWLPLIIANYMIFVCKVLIPRTVLFYYTINIINYFSSFVNPLVYALRIPEFRQALGLCCFRRQAVINKEGNEGRDNRAAALTVTQLRTLPTDPSHLQLAFKQKIMDTKLWSTMVWGQL